MPKVARSPEAASQREQAYRALRRMLVLQQVEAGERLREPEWSERLGIHRSALREAFARLEAEGLIERGQQTGYFVPRLTPQDFLEITKLRLAFECLAIEEICCQAAAPGLDALVQACDEFEQFLNGGYPLGVIEADRRFHESLIDAAGMRRLSALYHRAPLPLIHRHSESEDTWRTECVRTLAEHRQIVAALGERDAAKAKRLIRQHLIQRSILPMCH
jgi:DNA-binding GntR family transcriptional regulator